MGQSFSREDFLHHHCESDPASCWETVYHFWPLSLWIIEKEVLNRAALYEAAPEAHRKLLRDDHWKQSLGFGRGWAYVLFVTEADIRESAPYLKKAFALPLVWKENTAHYHGLPEELARLADQILSQVAPSNPWGLHLNFTPPCDLSNLDFQGNSGWAPLCAALYLVIEGGRPDPAIWATGEWDLKYGIVAIEGLRSKMEVVYEMGGRTFFVPESNFEAAREISGKIAEEKGRSPLEIRSLPLHRPNPKETLYPLLHCLESPPDQSRPLEERATYYVRQVEWRSPEAHRYYTENLLEELAKKCRSEGVLGMGRKALGAIENLITYVSLNPQGAFFVLSTLEIKRVLLFYTDQSKKHLSWVEERIPGGIVETIQVDKISSPEEDEKIHRAIKIFAERYNPSKTALDLTPGPKDFTVVASSALDPAVSPFLYLSHSWTDVGKVPRPGYERIRRVLGS